MPTVGMAGVSREPNNGAKTDVGGDHVPRDVGPVTEQARLWIKGHRTLIASSTSSVFSTLSAVSLLSATSKSDCC